MSELDPAAAPGTEAAGRAARAARVSVVMATRERAAEAAATVARLRALPERPPVIVVDNGSGDGTARTIARAHPDVLVISLDRNLGAAARTVGVAAARSPYVALCDDDTWWAPGALGAAAAVLDRNPGVAVVTGTILVGPERRLDAISGEMAASPLPVPAGAEGTRLASFLAGASVLRRRAYLAAGGFEPHLLIGGEEEHLAVDLALGGWDLRYAPTVIVHHHPSRRRDPHERRRQGIRNTLWFTWTRRPGVHALARTGQILASLPRDRVSCAGVLTALRGLPWVVVRRRPVPGRVESDLRLLESSQRASTARRYVS